MDIPTKKGKINYRLDHDLKSYINTDINKYKTILLNNYLCDDHVLVGQFATNIYNNIHKIGRLQIITSRSFIDEIKILKGLLGDSITYSINNLKIPTNLNLHKMIIYYENDHIIDIYDAGNFELITYNKVSDISDINDISDKIRVGTPFVIMRFRLIDIWSTLYNMKTGSITKNIAIQVVHKLIEEYVNIRKKMENIKIDNIFSINYNGFYEDTILKTMRVTAKLKISYIQPYMPYKAKK
jgi:hypothetical protein